MIKLALCDDETKQREAVGRLLREYAAARPALAVKLSVFSSGEELLDAARECGGFDLYVLDVVMPGSSGIDVGMRLRELYSGGAIIYLTVSPEYAVDSYAARAFYYLMKPAKPDKLFQVLDQAASALAKQRSACVAVRTKDGLARLRLDEIVYAELAGRAVRYHLADGGSLDSVTVRSPFQEEAGPLLADQRFFLCGASFVANLFYVAAVEKGFLRMDSGIRVPLARGLTALAKRRWSDFWLDASGGEAL
ncbi:MAG: LytTR family DNA-binding domain-containing protein [Dysosmobacter sp.]|nr:LytTR family DNA-binding domain-containing protein [Dysosmobacter sp.]